LKKTIKTIAISTAASAMFLASSVMAADQKIAVVNFQEIMGKIPQTAVIMKTLEAEFKDEKMALTKLETDIKYFQEKKKRDSMTMSKEQIAELDKEIATKFQAYQVQGKAFQQKTTARQNEETNKIIALVRQAVDKVAKAESYDLILESKSAVFVNPKLTITDEIIEEVSKLN
jgi:outer membrane protein